MITSLISPVSFSVHPHTRGEDDIRGEGCARGPVHPHTRGEDKPPIPLNRSRCGSPPHAWGRCLRQHDLEPHPRFTPTRVGKMILQRLEPVHVAVHPHTRGEDAQVISAGTPYSGSPPHAWGRYHADHCASVRPRFTPTRVGKMIIRARRQPALAVHPHTRGEDSTMCVSSSSPDGSPPHAWGRSRPPPRPSCIERFTPTRVGKIHPRHVPLPTRPVHPHTRGEDAPSPSFTCFADGSPPHAWGR